MKTLEILTDTFRRAQTARPLAHRARRKPGGRPGGRTAPLLWGSILAALLGGIMLSPASHATSRIKAIVNFEGVRDDLRVGYGLVVGLNATVWRWWVGGGRLRQFALGQRSAPIQGFAHAATRHSFATLGPCGTPNPKVYIYRVPESDSLRDR